MRNHCIRPTFKKKILIEGSVIFLVGPIGTFFSRIANYLEKNDIKTYKISFPLYEYGFHKSQRINYSDDISRFKEFLEKVILKKNIKHIFMYGNVLIPHKQALSLSDELDKKGITVNTHIFELGYLRPNFVTLEEKGVNYESSFIRDYNFYEKQRPFKKLPVPLKQGLRIRKIWKLISFLNHCFQNYKVVDFEHKLQPKTIYLWFQFKGFILKFFYKFSEIKLKKKCFSTGPFFLVILQVATDSQILKGSNFSNNKDFIYKVIQNFAFSQTKKTKLVFKHHPRDRGYNNYEKFIFELSSKFKILDRVFYIHDIPLSKVFRNKNCKGTVLINSTVGYQSLFHSIPIKSLGIAPYNLEGLADQNNLISFFQKPKKVNKLLFDKFYRFVLENSQINGNFDGFFPFESVFIFLNKN